LKTSGFDTKEILICVKAYPIASVSYGETVCCAGIDIKSQEWIRLYPVPFRDLESDQRFKKYSIIETKCVKAGDDLRPESYRIQSSSIKILKYLSTDQKWKERKEVVLKAPRTTFCQLKLDQTVHNTSLGLIKPKRVAFEAKKRRGSNLEKKIQAYAQPGLFDKPKKMIEEIHFQFYYHFFCDSAGNCPGHSLSIIDWEIMQAFRKWRTRYLDTAILLEKIKSRWLDIVDPAKKDAFLYVGNLHRFPNEFTVLGVFWPPQ